MRHGLKAEKAVRQPIEGPANWTAESIFASPQWIHELNAAELDEINAAVDHARRNGCTIATLEAKDFPLPTLGKVVAEARLLLEDGPGLYLLRGIPAEGFAKDDLRFIYWGIGKHLGTAVPQSADGDVLGDVRNIGLDRIYTSNKKGHFHCDLSDVVGLFVLRPAKSGGLTQVASSVAVHNEILRTRPDLLEVLYQPFHWSWLGMQPAGRDRSFSQPIFTEWRGKFSCSFIPALIRMAQAFPEVPRLTPAQVEAMALIEAISENERFHFAMRFEPGDLQFLNNHVCIHGRTAFDDFDELDRRRHLLRLWLAMPNSRELSPARGEYWDTRSGALRGGFGHGSKPIFETTGELQS